MSPSESPSDPCPCRAPTCLVDTHEEKQDGSSRCPASARRHPSSHSTVALSHRLKVTKHSVIVDVASGLCTEPLKHSHKANMKSMCKQAQSLITPCRLHRERHRQGVGEEPVLHTHVAVRDPLCLLRRLPILVHQSRKYLTHVSSTKANPACKYCNLTMEQYNDQTKQQCKCC